MRHGVIPTHALLPRLMSSMFRGSLATRDVRRDSEYLRTEYGVPSIVREYTGWSIHSLAGIPPSNESSRTEVFFSFRETQGIPEGGWRGRNSTWAIWRFPCAGGPGGVGRAIHFLRMDFRKGKHMSPPRCHTSPSHFVVTGSRIFKFKLSDSGTERERERQSEGGQNVAAKGRTGGGSSMFR